MLSNSIEGFESSLLNIFNALLEYSPIFISINILIAIITLVLGLKIMNKNKSNGRKNKIFYTLFFIISFLAIVGAISNAIFVYMVSQY